MTKDSPRLREVSKHEFTVDHVIRSPPARIFDAYTRPELVARWWTQPGKTLRIDTMEVRPGGAWRFVHLDGQGGETVMHGTYVEVHPVTRLAYTYNHGEGNANEILAVVDLRPVAQGTHVTLTSRCGSREQLDNMLKYGAKGGAHAALKALAALVEAR